MKKNLIDTIHVRLIVFAISLNLQVEYRFSEIMNTAVDVK